MVSVKMIYYDDDVPATKTRCQLNRLEKRSKKKMQSDLVRMLCRM